MCSKFLISSSLLVLTCLVASNAAAKVCFLPDCDGAVDIKHDINKDSKWCEKKGFTYYASGACPQYQKEVETCNKDDHYLKCDSEAWCKDKNNGYNKTSCTLPTFLDEQCPNGLPFYKNCKTDNPRACKQLGYKNTCSGGQKLHASNGRCSWDNSYGTCCSPSGCPSYTSLSYSSYGSNGSDGCGYTCYYTCNMNCPSGTSTSNPGGCGGSTRNGCNTKTCYYPYKACCTPSCTNQSGCAYGTTSVSDGCGGSCTRCKEQPCNSSHPRWCRVHASCHTDCCSDGSIASCDSRCGGSGCGSSTPTPPPPSINCSGTKPYVVNGACSECRYDSDCVNNIYPANDRIQKGETYAKSNLPYRYLSKCNTTTRECVEAHTLNDCKTTVANFVYPGQNGYASSPTAYRSGGGHCHCLTYYDVGKKECHAGDPVGGWGCATKECNSDADCVGFTKNGAATKCRRCSGGGWGFVKGYCIQNF